MKELPSTLKIATLWLVLGTLVFLGFQFWQDRERQSRIQFDGRAIELRRAPDGHFHWPGRLQGPAHARDIEFLVDTGATGTALPESLARQLGLQPEGEVRSSTAGGEVRGWLARADLALEGGVHAQRLRVTVLPELASPLLGMDVLSRLRFTQQGGVLRLEPAR